MFLLDIIVQTKNMDDDSVSNLSDVHNLGGI